MAMKTTYLIGLLAVGFFMLLLGWPWWLGVGLIVLSMALAVSGDEPREIAEAVSRLPEGVPQAHSAGAPVTEKPIEGKPSAFGGTRILSRDPDYFDDWGSSPPDFEMASFSDLNFEHSTPCDAIGGMKGMKTEDGVWATGHRTGTQTMDINEILRFKDDLRIKIDGMEKATYGKDAPAGMGWLDGAHTHRVYYRTTPKRIWPQRTAVQWKDPKRWPENRYYPSYDYR